MSPGILGKKIGMTQVFRADGQVVPVTVLRAGPCVVVQRKTPATDGYDAVQLGFQEYAKPSHINKPETGHLKKSGASGVKFLRELKLRAGDGDLKAGDRITKIGRSPAPGQPAQMIPVKDRDRSEKFCTGILGFKKIGRNERIVFLRAGDDYFNLTYSENPITTNVGNRHEIHSAFRLTPQAYDEALKTLSEQGIEVFKQEDRRVGVFVGRSAYIRDPDNNVIEFIDLVHARADPA